MQDRVMQSQYPPLYCMYSTIKSQQQQQAGDNNSKLNFSDACKLLLLNNIEGLTSRNILELYTSARLNKNTYALCSHILEKLADERHSSEVYQETFRYVLSPEVMKVDEVFLARYFDYFSLCFFVALSHCLAHMLSIMQIHPALSADSCCSEEGMGDEVCAEPILQAQHAQDCSQPAAAASRRFHVWRRRRK